MKLLVTQFYSSLPLFSAQGGTGPQLVRVVPYYTGCNRRIGPDFGRVFLRSYYTDITQNTYIQS
jgi:hypothetical protein